MYDPNSHIPMSQFNGSGKNCYSDYEELAFQDPATPWLPFLFESVKDIGGAFARDCQGYRITTDVQRQDFMDTVFYSSVHVCTSYYEANNEMSKERVNDVVEAVCYTMQVLMTNDYIVRSSIDWVNDPNPYATYVKDNADPEGGAQ